MNPRRSELRRALGRRLHGVTDAAVPALTSLAGDLDAVEITGFSVATDADRDSTGELLRNALATHGVVCLRFSAPLTDTEAREVAALLGPVKDPIGRARWKRAPLRRRPSDHRLRVRAHRGSARGAR